MDKVYHGRERRTFPRVSVNFIVVYRVNKPLYVRMLIGDKEINTVMIDLAQAGMAIVTDFDIPILTLLNIEFTLINTAASKNSRTRLINIRGEVRNNVRMGKNGFRLGISFIEVADQDKQSLKEFVDATLFETK